MAVNLIDLLIAADGEPGAPVVRLFGQPRVTTDGRVPRLPAGGKRLVAFVALRHVPVSRRQVARALWPHAGRTRAAGNLRSALWRLKLAGVDVISCAGRELVLRDDAVVDVRVVEGWALRAIRGRSTAVDLAALPGSIDALELLPGWYDQWVRDERERLRPRLVAALEGQSRQLTRLGRGAEAVQAAALSVAADPMRETAQRALIEAQLAEGNADEARHALLAYRALLRRELGADPHPSLVALVRDRLARPRCPAA